MPIEFAQALTAREREKIAVELVRLALKIRPADQRHDDEDFDDRQWEFAWRAPTGRASTDPTAWPAGEH
jgi:hypothetical protein